MTTPDGRDIFSGEPLDAADPSVPGSGDSSPSQPTPVTPDSATPETDPGETAGGTTQPQTPAEPAQE